jgi:probable rRNA maturation factor
MNLEIFNQEKFELPFLKDYLPKVKKEFKDVKQGVNIVFVDLDQIRELNKEYRRIDKATDVLSFNIDEGNLLGEVYICPEYVKREEQIPFQEEILRLIIHGILHLLGYDHTVELNEETKISEKMFVKQEKILQNVIS